MSALKNVVSRKISWSACRKEAAIKPPACFGRIANGRHRREHDVEASSRRVQISFLEATPQKNKYFLSPFHEPSALIERNA